MSAFIPRRIVCLSAEAADWLWRIGAWDQVAGITAYFDQSPDAPLKPRVSGFSSANLENIEKLNPDLIITFSDVQASLAGQLIQRGLPVLATNQRTLAEVENTLALLSRVVGREREGEKLLNEFRTRTAPVRASNIRPRVYFEEWNEPLISGIAWVSELIERAGGQDVFPELRARRSSGQRVVSTDEIAAADPEFIFASWCGKPVDVAKISSRPGWGDISAVRQNRIHEIASDDILQPGFRLTHGYETMRRLLTVAWLPVRKSLQTFPRQSIV